MDEELKKFMTQIDLRQFAAAHGFEESAKESHTGCTMMRNNNGDKIAVSFVRPERLPLTAVWFYVNNHDDTDKGTIIDFLQKRGGGSLGHIRKRLRPWIGETPTKKKLPQFKKLEIIEKDISRVAIQYEFAEWVAAVPYLVKRGLDVSITNSFRFRQTFKVDERQNVLFPHRNKNYDVCGFEKKNYGFTGFAKGAYKGLWSSNCDKSDTTLVITETAIDALSYDVLKRPNKTRYVSTGGNISDEQLALLRKAMEKDNIKNVFLALDNDKDGEKLAKKIKEVAPSHVRIVRPVPRSKDWNQDLKNKLGL